MPARPLAVLTATNKRGRGIFNEHEEQALVRLCAGVESLLRSKAAEVSLLLSGIKERCLIRKSNNRGGAGGAWSNHARVESTIMRLYSEASFPADAVALRRQQGVKSAERHHRSRSDNSSGVFADVVKKSGSGLQRKTSVSDSEQPLTDDEMGRVHRMLTEELELVDLSMSLFKLSSEKLLSLVARFFARMELMDRFQVCLFLPGLLLGGSGSRGLCCFSGLLPAALAREVGYARPRTVFLLCGVCAPSCLHSNITRDQVAGGGVLAAFGSVHTKN